MFLIISIKKRVYMHFRNFIWTFVTTVAKKIDRWLYCVVLKLTQPPTLGGTRNRNVWLLGQWCVCMLHHGSV